MSLLNTLQQALAVLSHCYAETDIRIKDRREYLDNLRTAIEELENAKPFAYWFPWEERYVSVEVANKYFNYKERSGWLVPIYTHPTPAVPVGWQLVPIEPTNAMLSAMADASEDPDNERSSCDLASSLYKAMLEAAPKGTL